jgi:N-acyl-D-amino-acid deacylase
MSNSDRWRTESPGNDFDVVLEGGWVVDGTGAPPARVDLGLRADRVAAVATLTAARADERVDCTGRYLLPGFVDAHVHGDAVVFEHDVQLAALAQGVTTFIVGQDGLGFAPASQQTAAYVTAYFGAVNGRWPGKAPPSVAEQLTAYDSTTPLNVGILVPHGNLRYEVIGAADRPATADECTAMRDLLGRGLDEGALGLSSGLDYVPGRFADAAELAALAEVAARRGVPYVTHMRGYEAAAAVGIAEVRAIAEISGVRPHVSHYHGPAHMLVELIDGLRRDGIDATFDSYPYTSGSSILAMVAIPAELQSAGPAETLRKLADPSVRADLKRDWFAGRTEFDNVRLSYVDGHEFSWAEGLSLRDGAEQLGRELGDFVCDLLVAAQLRAGCVFRQPPTNTDADICALLKHEAQMAGSDGIFFGAAPHPRGWGTFARLLGVHTRARADWSWAEAAVHLAGHPARRFGLAERGLLRPGYHADVVVLDPARVSDRATYGDPRQPAEGIDRVYVNGVLAYSGGVLRARHCGRGLRSGSLDATWSGSQPG